MDQRKEILLLMYLTFAYKNGDYYKLVFDDIYFDDSLVSDCKFKLYMLLLTAEEKEQDKRFKEFEESYKKLSKEKQEYIRGEIKKIFEEQDKNNKEKEKKL